MPSQPNKVDVLIFGAGIAGLGVAMALAKKGKRVLVVGRDLEGEASPRAAGILNPFLGLDRGSPMLPLTMKAFRGFPSFIREIEKKTGLKAGYKKSGVLYVALDRAETAGLRKKYEWQRKLPLGAHWQESAELHRLHPELASEVKAGVFYREVSRIHPGKMMKAVTAYARKLGVRILKTGKAPRLERLPDGTFFVKAGGSVYRAPVVVNAAGSWSRSKDLFSAFLPVEPARGQILILKGRSKLSTILHSVKEGYIVPWEGGRYLAGSTVEFVGHKAEVTAQGVHSILRSLDRILPSVRNMKIERSWAGLRPYSDKPILGKHPHIKNLYFATGYFRSGILLGPYLGSLLAEMIVTGKQPVELRRFRAKGGAKA
ncbi:MAG TPA: FAD-dependent oxidoreductase [Verrucomicrobiae bacterium]|jgi:glycine oxidase ThiO|nr:FAD-dependent oxidoreductase [Verrucomicrobiae bacterium]